MTPKRSHAVVSNLCRDVTCKLGLISSGVAIPGALIRADITKWANVVKAADIDPGGAPKR